MKRIINQICIVIHILLLSALSVSSQSEVLFTFLPEEFVDIEGYDRLNDSITIYYGTTYDSAYVWRTDGTLEGSYIIHRSKYRTGSMSTEANFPEYLGAIHGKAYISLFAPETGKEIWVINEHGNACTLWKDYVPGPVGLFRWQHSGILKPKTPEDEDFIYFIARYETSISLAKMYIMRFNEMVEMDTMAFMAPFWNDNSPVFRYGQNFYGFSFSSNEAYFIKYNSETEIRDTMYADLPFSLYFDCIQKDSIIFILSNPDLGGGVSPYFINLESGTFEQSNLVGSEIYSLDFRKERDTRMYSTQYGVFFSLARNGKWEVYRTDGTVAGMEKITVPVGNTTDFGYMPHGFTDWGTFVYFYYRKAAGQITLARWSPSTGTEDVKQFSSTNVYQKTRMELLPYKGCFVLPFCGLIDGKALPFTHPWLYCPATDTWTLLADPTSYPNIPYEPEHFHIVNDTDIRYVANEDYTQLFEVKDLKVSVENETSKPSIQLLPNPAQDILYLSDITTKQIDYGRCTILDMQGRMIMNTNLDGYPAINISTLAPGQYLLRLEWEDQAIALSFIKM